MSDPSNSISYPDNIDSDDHSLSNINVPYRQFKFQSILLSEEALEDNVEPSNKLDDELNSAIGELLFKFSSLVYGIEYEIAQLYDMSNYEVGRSVVKFLNDADKFQLLHELHLSRLNRVPHIHKIRVRKQLANLLRMLIEAAELRNIVAHASWVERTEEGYVKTSHKQSKETGRYVYLLYKLNANDLKAAVAHIDKLIEDQCHVWEFSML